MKSNFHSNFIKYRPDIDGLRAIAVSIVVLYHSGLSTFSGGFVGVDVFFVISGFLITQDILNRANNGGFTFIEFYLRRARRILPALFFVLLLSTVAAIFIMPPNELVSYSKSFIAAVFSLSNILFYRRDGYFTASSEQEPLLHIWSLAVEEQFYVFWPLIIMLAFRFGRFKALLLLLATISTLSLILAQYLLIWDPKFSFFMLPTRAWELAIGALLAVTVLREQIVIGKRTSAFLGVSGLSMILIATFCYTASTPFPGITALLPIVGTAAIILAGLRDNTAVAQLLSQPPIIFVGLVSYPLYLVHWPILVFWKMVDPTSDSVLLLISQLILMLISSWLIYRFVERPFRKYSTERQNWKPWLVGVSVATIIAAAFTGTTVLYNGYPQRGPGPAAWQTIARQDSNQLQNSPCLSRNGRVPTDKKCVVGQPNDQPTAVLWGDSHAMQIAPAFLQAAKKDGLAAIVMTKAGCPPIPSTDFRPMSQMLSACREFNAAVLSTLDSISNLRKLVIAAHWESWIDGTHQILDSDGKVPPDHQNLRIIENRLEQIQQLSGASLAIVGMAPIGSGTAFSCAVRADFTGQDPNICLAGARQAAERAQETFLKTVPKDSTFINYLPILCSNSGFCSGFTKEYSMLQDNTHLSNYAALKLAPELSNFFGIENGSVD